MQRKHLIPVVTFTAGVLSGAIALAGYQSLSAETPPQPSAAPAPTSAPSSEPAPAARAIASSEPEAVPEPEPVSATEVVAADTASEPLIASLDAELQGMAAGWSRLEGELERLRARVVRLEERLIEAQAAGPGDTPARAQTPEDRRSALEAAGLDLARAEEIVWRQGQHELEQLEVRDLAVREGWFGTDRYREEIRRLEEGRLDLRAELGDEIYDRYLYAAGEDNRLRVDAIIPGSAAEGAGLMPGDLIETYDGALIFSVPELRGATTGGERGEEVNVTVRRADGTRVQAWLPRGPLGVRLEPTRARPDA